MPPTLSVLKHGLCLGGAGIGDNHFAWGPAWGQLLKWAVNFQLTHNL